MSYSFRRGVCKPHTLPTLHRPFRTNSLPLTTLLLTHWVPATLTFPSPLWLINDCSLFNWRNLIFWEFNTWVLYLHRSPLTFPLQFLPCPLNFLPKSRPLLCLLQWHIYIIFLSKSLGLFSHLLAKLFPGHPQYPFPFLPSICCWGAISLKILSPSTTANIKPSASLHSLMLCFSSELSALADPSCTCLSPVFKVTPIFQHPGQHPATGNQWMT